MGLWYNAEEGAIHDLDDGKVLCSETNNTGKNKMTQTRHWSEDAYWSEALEQLHRLQEDGQTQIILDLPAILAVAFRGDGPAYKLMEAMVSVQEQEGMEGFKGAPRVMLALLVRLEELSHSDGQTNGA